MTMQLARETIGDGFSLVGHRALITGSSRGLGLAMARGLARAGAQVLINGRDPATLDPLAAHLRDEGLDAVACPFDAADPRAAARALSAAAEQYGPTDILVNNVGQRDRRPLEAITPADMTRLLGIDLIPAYALTRQVAAQLQRLGQPGRIINISSILGQLGRHGDPAYSTVKAALEGLTRSLSVDLGPYGITVNAVAPGAFATETNAALVDDPYWTGRLAHSALGRWGHPDEIAGIVTFLACDASSYITVEESFELGKGCFGLDQCQARLYTAILRHAVLVMAALAICATAAQLKGRTDTQVPPPARPDAVPPDDTGLIPLTTREVRRLLAMALQGPKPPGHAARWVEWRRRHQARSRWFHQRARLARDYTLVS